MNIQLRDDSVIFCKDSSPMTTSRYCVLFLITIMCFYSFFHIITSHLCSGFLRCFNNYFVSLLVFSNLLLFYSSLSQFSLCISFSFLFCLHFMFSVLLLLLFLSSYISKMIAIMPFNLLSMLSLRTYILRFLYFCF